MMRRRLLLAALPAALAACGALPEKPVRQEMYDLGPVPADAQAAPTGPALVLPEVDVNGVLEGTSLLYRLDYADPFQLRAYAFARWSAAPGQLVRQRLRLHIGEVRPVLDSAAAAALARRSGVTPPVLRVELEEFNQVFDTQASSQGVVRLRCTLLEVTAAGERLVAQRIFSAQRAAPTADAPGGVRALTAATDAVAQDIVAWLRNPT